MGTNFTDIEPTDPVIAATINDRLDQLDAAIQAGVGGIILTNKSGGALAANDAVVIDTANNEAVTTTTSAGDVNRPGVVIAGGANNAEVTVSLLGEVAVVVDGAGSRGDWIKTSTTAKRVTPVATLDEGVFGVLTSDSSGGAGTTATALLLGLVVVEPPAHNHAAADITSGQLALERGGTEADLGATGPGYLKQAGAGAVVTVGAIAAGDLPAATTGAQGAVELATDAETQTGTDPDRAVTPAGAASAYIAKVLLTTKGDIVARDTSGPTRLGVGSDTQVLAADSAEATGLKWVPQVAGGAGIPGETIDAKGDLIAGTADDTYTRLAVGSDGQTLIASSGQSTGLAWADLLPRNLLYHSLTYDIWPTGSTFSDIANDNYVAGIWNVIHNGNPPDITRSVNVDGVAIACAYDQTGTQVGFLQFLTAEDTRALQGKTLSFQIHLNAAFAAGTNFRAAILGWSGTADTLTSNVVSAWDVSPNDPTLAASWEYLNTPADITGTSDVILTVEGALLDDASINNIAVFIWNSDLSTNTVDNLELDRAKLEIGPVASSFTSQSFLSERTAVKLFVRASVDAPADGSANVGNYVATAIATGTLQVWIPFDVAMRATPHTVTLYRSNLGAVNGTWSYYAGGFLDPTSSTPTGWKDGVTVTVAKAATFTVGNSHLVNGHYLADARL